MDAANLQAEASAKQADAASKTLELLLEERRMSDSYQRVVFQHEFAELSKKLNHYVRFIRAGVKNHEPEKCFLLPQQWDICIEYVSRHIPNKLTEFQQLAEELKRLSAGIEGIRMTPEKWDAISQRREKAGNDLDTLRYTLARLLPQ